VKRVSLCACIAAIAAAAVPAGAHAAPIMVNDPADPGAAGGTCTLREAIVSANMDDAGANGCANGAGADAITFTVPTPATITLNGTQLPEITAPLTITGPGVTVSANFTSRAFEIDAGDTVTMTGLTIADGFLAGAQGAVNPGADGGDGGDIMGAGILNAGTLSLTGVTVRDHLAVAGQGGAGGTVNPGNNGRLGGNGGDASGGAIYSTGPLTVTGSTLSGNRALGGLGGDGGHAGGGAGAASGGNAGIGGDGTGGAIASVGGTLTIADSTFSDNEAYGDGGGDGGNGAGGGGGGPGGNGGLGTGGAIANTLGQTTITGSTVNGNRARGGFGGDTGFPAFVPDGLYGSGVGAGVEQHGVPPQTLTITNSTISGNEASAFGIGFAVGGGVVVGDAVPLNATHVTLVDNAAPNGGANLVSNNGLLTLRATIIAGLAAGPQASNCLRLGASTVTSMGFNLDDGTSCDFGPPGPATDLESTEPNLAPLGSYGGPTQTHLPLTGSPALNAVTAACPPPANDQRGMVRPLNACDIGAVERQAGDVDPPPGGGPSGGGNPPIQGSPPATGPTGQRAAALKKCNKIKSKKKKKNCKRRARKRPV
jgi:CSLREA domain-containing protein